jgi:ribokinase
VGRVVVVGSLNVDLTLNVAAIPRPGETVLALDQGQGCGGKGANQAVAAARAGAATLMVGCVGTDPGAELLLARLGADGVDVSRVTAGPWPTGLAVVAVDETGENAIIVAAGANGHCGAGQVRDALADLRSGDVVVAQGEIPVDAIGAAASAAAAAGARFVLNLAPPVPVGPELLAGVAVLVVNEHEAAAVLDRAGVATGPDPRDRDGVARQVAVTSGAAAVVTLGGRGVLLAEAPDAAQVEVPAIRPPRIVDTTGAGDAFVGALCAALAGGYPLADAVRWGAAAGSIAVAAAGAQGGRATPEAIQALLDSDNRLDLNGGSPGNLNG